MERTGISRATFAPFLSFLFGVFLFVVVPARADHATAGSPSTKAAAAPSRTPSRADTLKTIVTIGVPESPKDTRASLDRAKDWIRSLTWVGYQKFRAGMLDGSLFDAFTTDQATVKGFADAASLTLTKDAWRESYNIFVAAFNALSGDEILDSVRRVTALKEAGGKGTGPFSKAELVDRRRALALRIVADLVESERTTGTSVEQKERQRRLGQFRIELALLNSVLGLPSVTGAGPKSVQDGVHAFYENPEKFFRHASDAPKEAAALIREMLDKGSPETSHDVAPAYWALRRAVNGSAEHGLLAKAPASGMGTTSPHGLVDLVDRAPHLSATDLRTLFKSMSRPEFDAYFQALLSTTPAPGFDPEVWRVSRNRLVGPMNAFQSSTDYTALGAVPKSAVDAKASGKIDPAAPKSAAEMLELFRNDRPAFQRLVLSSKESSQALAKHIETLVRALDPASKDTPKQRERLLEAYWPARLAAGTFPHDPQETYAPKITRFNGETHILAGTPEPFLRETGGDFSLNEAAFVQAFDHLDDASRRGWLLSLPVKALLNFYGRLRGEGAADGYKAPAGVDEKLWDKQALAVQTYLVKFFNEEKGEVSKLYVRALSDPKEAALFVPKEWHARRAQALLVLRDVGDELATLGKDAGPRRARLEALRAQLVGEIALIARHLGERPPPVLTTGLDHILLLRTDPVRFEAEVGKLAAQPGGHEALQDLVRELIDSHQVAHELLPVADRKSNSGDEKYDIAAGVARDIINAHLPKAKQVDRGFGLDELHKRAWKIDQAAAAQTKAICSEPTPLTLERFLLASGARFGSTAAMQNGHRILMGEKARGIEPGVPLLVRVQEKKALDEHQFVSSIARMPSQELVELERYYAKRGDRSDTPAWQLELIRGLLTARAIDGPMYAQHYVSLLGLGLEKVPTPQDVHALLQRTGADPARFARFLFFSAKEAEALAAMDKSCRDAFEKIVSVPDPNDPGKSVSERRNEVAHALMRLRRMLLVEGSGLPEGGIETAHQLWNMDNHSIEALVGAIATAPPPPDPGAAKEKEKDLFGDDEPGAVAKGAPGKGDHGEAKSGTAKGGAPAPQAKGEAPKGAVTGGEKSDGKTRGLFEFLIHLQYIRTAVQKGDRVGPAGKDDIDRPVLAVAHAIERAFDKKLVDFAAAVKAGNTTAIRTMLEQFRASPYLQTMAILTKANEKNVLVPPEVVAAVNRVFDRRLGEFNALSRLMEPDRNQSFYYKSHDGHEYFFLPNADDGRPRIMTRADFESTLQKRMDNFQKSLETFYAKAAAMQTGGNRLYEAVLQGGLLGLGADPKFKTAEHIEATQAEKDMRRAMQQVSDLSPGHDVMKGLYKAAMDAYKAEGKMAGDAATRATWIAGAIIAAPLVAFAAPAALPAGGTLGTFLLGKIVVPALIGGGFAAFGSIRTQMARIEDARRLGKEASFDWGEFWGDTAKGAGLGVAMVNLPAGLGAYAIPAAGTFVAVDAMGSAHVNFRNGNNLAGTLDLVDAATAIAFVGKARARAGAPATAPPPTAPPAAATVSRLSRFLAPIRGTLDWGAKLSSPATVLLAGNLYMTNPTPRKAYTDEGLVPVPWALHEIDAPADPKHGPGAAEKKAAAPTTGLVRHAYVLKDSFIEGLAKLGPDGHWVDIGNEHSPTTTKAVEEYLAEKASPHFKEAREIADIYGKARGKRAQVTSFTPDLPPGVEVGDHDGRLHVVKGTGLVTTREGTQIVNQDALDKMKGSSKAGVDLVTDTHGSFISSASRRPDLELMAYLSAVRKGGAVYLASPQLVLSKVDTGKGAISVGDWIKRTIESDPVLSKMVRVEWGEGGKGGIDDPMILRVVDNGVAAYLQRDGLASELQPHRPPPPPGTPAGAPPPLPTPATGTPFGNVYRFVEHPR